VEGICNKVAKGAEGCYDQDGSKGGLGKRNYWNGESIWLRPTSDMVAGGRGKSRIVYRVVAQGSGGYRACPYGGKATRA